MKRAIVPVILFAIFVGAFVFAFSPVDTTTAPKHPTAALIQQICVVDGARIIGKIDNEPQGLVDTYARCIYNVNKAWAAERAWK